jgi:hypothetical protein
MTERMVVVSLSLNSPGSLVDGMAEILSHQ